jgi:hypothetical protein
MFHSDKHITLSPRNTVQLIVAQVRNATHVDNSTIAYIGLTGRLRFQDHLYFYPMLQNASLSTKQKYTYSIHDTVRSRALDHPMTPSHCHSPIFTDICSGESVNIIHILSSGSPISNIRISPSRSRKYSGWPSSSSGERRSSHRDLLRC